MTRDTERRVYEIYRSALEVPPGERGDLLDSACAGADDVREEVEELLRAHERMGGFLEDGGAHGLVGSPSDAPVLPAGARVGAWRVERILGAGAAGVVYEAARSDPERRVALKVMHVRLESTGARRRFLSEAETLARISHPAIGTVYEAGVDERDGTSLPWIALELVEGGTPLTRHADRDGLSIKDRLRLFAAVCDAMHRAHEKGIVHRDLKPGNILVDREGQPKIIDFGIAARRGETSEIAGTPPYMSPEQGEGGGEAVDVRSDVYSLGVILQELLSGRSPRDAGEAAECHSPPEPLGARVRRVRGDLEAIVARATAYDREDRYSSAAALCDDVRRFLAFRPVEARPAHALRSVTLFARRQKLAFASLVALSVAVVAATIVTSWSALEKDRALRRVERGAYLANLSAALAAIRTGDVGEARRRLEAAPGALRDWEWHHLRGRVDRSAERWRWRGHSIRTGAVDRDHELVLVSGRRRGGPKTNFLRILASRTGKPVLTVPLTKRADSLATSPDGALIAIGYLDGEIELRDARTGELRVRLAGHVAPDRPPHETHVNALAFTSEGGRLLSASGDGTIGVWSIPDGEEVRRLRNHEDRVICLAVRPGGGFVSGDRSGAVLIWDGAVGEPRRIRAHRDSVESVALDPAGERAVTSSRDGTVRLWDLERGVETARGEDHLGNVRGVTFLPDGRIASAGWDRTVRIWRPPSGAPTGGAAGPRPLELAAVLRAHEERVEAVHLLPDGRLASFGREGTIRVWPARPGPDVPVLTGHADQVTGLAFLRSGLLASVSGEFERRVRLWDPAAAVEVRRFPPGPPFGEFAMTGPSLAGLTGNRFITGGWRTPARILGADGKSEVTFDGECIALASTRAGDRVALADHSGGFRILDLEAESERRPVNLPELRICSVAWAGTDRILAGTLDGQLLLIDLDPVSVRRQRRLGRGPVTHLDTSPDGERVAAVADRDRIVICATSTLQTTARLGDHGGGVHGIAFSPRGTRLASGGENGTIRLWDPVTGDQVLVLAVCEHPVLSVAFSPDGHWLAAGGGNPDEPGTILLYVVPRRTD